MRRRARAVMAAFAAIVVTVGVVGCSNDGGGASGQSTSSAPAPAAEFAATLKGRVTTDAMMARLKKLQEIADANGGNRALGSPGYDASVDYVAGVLRDKGFDVQTADFEVRQPFADEPVVTVGGQRVKSAPLKYTAGTAQGGVTGPLVAARKDDTPGCTATDYDGVNLGGAVALVDRGSCPFAVKAAVAVERGAVALVVANNVEGDQMGGTLGEDAGVKIPVVSITKADGDRLRTNPGTTTVELHAGVRLDRTRNVVAQTKTGSAENVVMAGAHLDSVPEGPGINDNGSGVAAILETAVQLGSSPPVQNAVRFAFWGAEEEGLIGSTKYIQTLDAEALKSIALYLNFDMLASPNPGYFTYDGDQSAPPSPNGAPRVPEGSAGIERTLAAYLAGAGREPRDTDFDGRSDYDAFTLAGIPAGGLFSGAEDKKNEEEAKIWGGEAGQPFDPNYHKNTDTFDNLDRDALGIHGGGVAYAIGLYAQDESGRNGVPVRGDRTRHVVKES